jgi:hypothetical protein
MKVAIDEISKFINEGWPGPDWYMDDCGPAFEEHFSDDGETPKAPGTKVELADFECAICWQGKGEDPSPHGDGYSFLSLFRKWKRSLTVTIVVAEVPNNKLDAVKLAIQADGGKVL